MPCTLCLLRWVIRHSPGDYKTGKLYGKRPPMVIGAFIHPELEAFISCFRCGAAVGGSGGGGWEGRGVYMRPAVTLAAN